MMGPKRKLLLTKFLISILITAVVAVLIILTNYAFRSPDDSDTFNTVCINGVKYYVKAKGNQGYMAVTIDHQTLMPVRCGV